MAEHPVTYAESIQFLYDLQLHGLKLGLDNTLRLAELAGDPHRQLRFVHVAGTNGKGSTCAMLESIYRTAGYRVGLFTSPHLVSFTERIQVDRRPIDETQVVRWASRLRDLLHGFPSDHSPTFFEVVTILALCHFAEQGCDVVVWETGMGGRLDATNIVRPVVSVITNIQHDHEKWLGHTLARIAAEKAGILKPGIPAVTGTDLPEALAVIRAAAGLVGAPLVEVVEADIGRPPLDSLNLPLLGDHQRRNAAVALATIEATQAVLPVPPAASTHGLLHTRWAGRLQAVTHGDGTVTLLDGAHNPGGTEALRAALGKHFAGQAPALILGVLEDKDWHAMCHSLLPAAGSVWLVPVESQRSARPADLLAECEATCRLPIRVADSLHEALVLTAGMPLRLITGSLYLVGEAMQRLGVLPSPARGEEGLNDWLPGPPVPR